ncbi:MAG: hypothetical protein ACK5TN_15345 [Acidobacteriota bacterium]
MARLFMIARRQFRVVAGLLRFASIYSILQKGEHSDLKRRQLMARMVALIYHWWSIFTRMGTGAKHGEAITTRALFEQSVAKKTRHANQTRLSISSLHARAKRVAHLLGGSASGCSYW